MALHPLPGENKASAAPAAAPGIPRSRSSGRLAALSEADSLIALASVLSIGFAAVQIAVFAFGRDQSIYAEVGQRLLQGHLPYHATWDFKPPGVFLLYALAFALFGHGLAAPRLLEIVFLLLGSALLLSLSKSFFVTRRPGWIAAGIWAWTYAQFDFWHTGQPESFAAMLTLLGFWLLLRVPDARRPWLVAAGVGAVFGLTALLKPPLGGSAIVAAAYLVQQVPVGGGRLRPILGRLVALGVGLGAPTLLVGFGFLLAGGFGAMAWTLFEFTPHYTTLGWRPSAIAGFYDACVLGFVRYSALIAVGSLAAIAGPIWSTREHEGKYLLLGGISVHFVGIAMQAKFFPYHFGATLPLLALLAGLGWAKLSRWFERAGSHGALLTLPLLALAASAREPLQDLHGTFLERSLERWAHVVGGFQAESARELERKFGHVSDYDFAANRDVAERVKQLTNASDNIYVWGFEPSIYWLSERRPTSRFIYNVPQRCEWSQTQTREELMRDLQQQVPKVVVVQHDDRFEHVTGTEDDSAETLLSFDELRTLLEERYHFEAAIEDFDLYVLNP